MSLLRVLDLIEDNEFDAITAPIFVKGYLRAYARIVLLNEDEMIAQYVELFSDDDPTINTISTMASEITVDDARIKWTTFLVIFILIVLLGIWWWNKSQNKADVFSLDALQTDTLVQYDSTDDTMRDDIEADSETFAGSTNKVFGTQPVDVSLETPAPTEELSQMPGLQSDLDEIRPEEFAVEAAEQEPTVDTGVELDTTPISIIAPMGSDQLILTVHADTWADIKDSGGNQLVYDLLRAGQELKMTGLAPFVVFLGNGHGVELNFNNESVELTNSIRDDNTARLKIGS